MLEAIRTRRSIRRYEDRPIEPELIEQLQEAMLRVPSSRNLKPWRFLFVTDKPTLDKLAHAKPLYGGFIAKAPLAVVICGDESASDCWIEDCSIAGATLQLAATELGLGSCWVQIRARKHLDGSPAEGNVRATLGLPEKWSVLCVVSVGYPAEVRESKDRAKLDWDKVETR